MHALAPRGRWTALMADDDDDAEKTEDPSQRQLDEALRHGDVAKSQEVNAWFVTAAARPGADELFRLSRRGELRSCSATLLANAAQVPDDACRPGRSRPAHRLARCRRGRRSVSAARARRDLRQHHPAPAGLVGRRAGAEGSRESRPLSGMRRLFSRQALAGFAKGLVKLVDGRRRFCRR